MHRAEITLVQKENELSNVKKLYCAAVKEKQKLTNEAEVCRRKMSAASTLINGLSGEKMRWTQQSKAFKEQMLRYLCYFPHKFVAEQAMPYQLSLILLVLLYVY